jgi:hypothetical protein
VDIYHGQNNVWTSALLSEARACPVAASLDAQNVALFAGGIVKVSADGELIDDMTARQSRFFGRFYLLMCFMTAHSIVLQ